MLFGRTRLNAGNSEGRNLSIFVCRFEATRVPSLSYFYVVLCLLDVLRGSSTST